jgi:hypothetical protein
MCAVAQDSVQLVFKKVPFEVTGCVLASRYAEACRLASVFTLASALLLLLLLLLVTQAMHQSLRGARSTAQQYSHTAWHGSDKKP